MSRLVLKGHTTRGMAVIQLLVMLGAKSQYTGTFKGFYYWIEDGQVTSSDVPPENSIIFSLEEFEEKYPYKVGDKVTLDNKLCSIIWMCWECNNIYYQVQGIGDVFTKKVTAEKLKPYKEETMEEKDKAKAPDLKGEDYSGRRFGYKIPNGYEFDCFRKNEIILKPIKPQYPTTYGECCDILGYDPSEDEINCYKGGLIESFVRLLICRNAYWKIAGEQMGLYKPWNQVYNDRCFIISNCSGNIHIYEYHGSDNVILAFPTAEMRDEFYDNFRDLIESCKDLL